MAKTHRLHLAAFSDASGFGGAEHSLGNLLSELPDRYEISVVGTTESVVAEIADRRPDARRILVPTVDSKRQIGAIARLTSTIRSLRPDILHANLQTPWSGRYGILAALVTPGVDAIAVEQLPMPTESRLQRWTKRQASLRLAAHVAVGKAAARQIEDMVGLHRGRVRAIYNGIPDIPLKSLPPLERPPIIGSLGRLTDQKGYDVLLHALQRLQAGRVVIVGDGPERSRLEALAEELGISDRFEICGWHDDARRYLPGFDVFVLPSRFEGFPLSIVEAMLAGTPVVASDVGSIAEAIENGYTGLLVPPDDPEALADSLRRLLDDQELRQDLATAARERAQAHFTAAAMAEQFVALYEEIIARRTSGALRGGSPAPRS